VTGAGRAASGSRRSSCSLPRRGAVLVGGVLLRLRDAWSARPR